MGDENMGLHDGNNPFESIEKAAMSAFTLMLGDFDIDAFTTPFMKGSFLIFLMIVFVVWLNVLIAIVGVACDYARSEARHLYCFKRFHLIVNLETAYPKVTRDGGRLQALTVFFVMLIVALPPLPLWTPYFPFLVYLVFSDNEARFDEWFPSGIFRPGMGTEADDEEVPDDGAMWDDRACIIANARNNKKEMDDLAAHFDENIDKLCKITEKLQKAEAPTGCST